MKILQSIAAAFLCTLLACGGGTGGVPASVEGTWSFLVVRSDCGGLPVLEPGLGMPLFAVSQSGSTVSAQFTEPGGSLCTLAGQYVPDRFTGSLSLAGAGRTVVLAVEGYARFRNGVRQVDGWGRVESDSEGECEGGILEFCATIGGEGGPPNASPTLTFLDPSAPVTVAPGTGVPIRYVDNDPDDVATTDLYADRDGDLGTTGDRILIAAGRPEQGGAVQSVTWNTGGAAPGTYRILGRTTDGRITIVREAPGAVTIESASPAPSGVPTLAFARSDGGEFPHDLAGCPDGSVVVVGAFAGTKTFGTGGPNEVSFTEPRFDRDGAVARYNADGSLAWASHVTGPRNDQPDGVACFADGSIVVSGAYVDRVTFGPGESNETTLVGGASQQQGFIARYSAGGSLAWARDGGRGSGNVFPVAMAGHADGSFVVTGNFTLTATFGPGETNETVLTSAGDLDAFIARYNADGSLAWARKDGGADRDSGRAVALLDDGSVVLAGEFRASATFGAGEANETVVTNAGSGGAFVARYDAGGMLSWAVQAGGSALVLVTSCEGFPDGSCVVGGTFTETTVFGAGEPGEATFTATDFDPDSFLARYRADGSLAWARAVPGPGLILLAGLAARPDGSVIACGSFEDTATFGAGGANPVVLASEGAGASFLAQYDAGGDLAWARRETGPGSAHAQEVVILPGGAIAVMGSSSGTVTFGAGEPNETTLTPESLTTFIIRFDPVTP